MGWIWFDESGLVGGDIKRATLSMFANATARSVGCAYMASRSIGICIWGGDARDCYTEAVGGVG
jgi:hypothetical protein